MSPPGPSNNFLTPNSTVFENRPMSAPGQGLPAQGFKIKKPFFKAKKNGNQNQSFA
jgi:hypothetical protein